MTITKLKLVRLVKLEQGVVVVPGVHDENFLWTWTLATPGRTLVTTFVSWSNNLTLVKVTCTAQAV